jgi:hypothetical protein
MVPVPSPTWSEDELNRPVVVAESPGDISLPWTFIALSADGKRIQVVYTAGDHGCVTFAGVLVSQTAESVTLTATGRYTSTPPPSACPAMLLQGAGTVSLDAPLDGRDLIHASLPVPGFPSPAAGR